MKSTRPLTVKEQILYKILCNPKHWRLKPPTMREMQKLMRVKYVGSITASLKSMERKGFTILSARQAIFTNQAKQ